MIQDELSPEAKNIILKAVREGLGLNYNVADSPILAELDKSGYGNSFGNDRTFVLTSKTISEVIDILKTAFEVRQLNLEEGEPNGTQ